MKPIPLGAPPRSRLGRVGVALTVGVIAALAASALAWTSLRDNGPSEVTTGGGASPDGESTAGMSPGEFDSAHTAMEHQHEQDHEPLAPYAERYDFATIAEQDAADQLLADVRETLKAYEDVDAAVADGYKARRKRGITHYLHPDLARTGAVLDPAHPTGLVYFTAHDHDPVLLGAFFIAPAGVPAPMPAGELVVWHAHRNCPGFLATVDQPCLDARRMLHVWTFDEVTLPGDRRGQREPRTLRVVDPFAVPFKAGVEPVDRVDD